MPDQADNRMQKTLAGMNARILKAIYVLAPILLTALVLYGYATQFIPAGYYQNEISGWILLIFAVQILVLIWVRKLPALISLNISVLAAIIVFWAGDYFNIDYLCFAWAKAL